MSCRGQGARLSTHWLRHPRLGAASARPGHLCTRAGRAPGGRKEQPAAEQRAEDGDVGRQGCGEKLRRHVRGLCSPVPQFLWAAMTIPQPRGLINSWLLSHSLFISHSSGGWKPKVRAPADLVSGEGVLAHSGRALAGTPRGGEAEGAPQVSVVRAPIPFVRLHPHDLITSQRPRLPIPSRWG